MNADVALKSFYVSLINADVAFMSVYERLWAFMSVYERLWAFMSVYERLWAFMSFYVSLISSDVALKSYNLASTSKTTTPSKHGSYIV